MSFFNPNRTYRFAHLIGFERRFFSEYSGITGEVKLQLSETKGVPMPRPRLILYQPVASGTDPRLLRIGIAGDTVRQDTNAVTQKVNYCSGSTEHRLHSAEI